MSSALAAWLQVGLLIVALAACYVPLGNYMAAIFTSEKHWRPERRMYKIIGIDPAADPRWSAYLRSMLAFSLVSVLFLYGLERLQHYLLLSLGMANVPPAPHGTCKGRLYGRPAVVLLDVVPLDA